MNKLLWKWLMGIETEKMEMDLLFMFTAVLQQFRIARYKNVNYGFEAQLEWK